ncbi:MAG TPA: hypothetical protein VM618_12400 [Acidimicrobiia bacterium]|nr:hypothetical protein [Acidimicrobiia bacterium]
MKPLVALVAAPVSALSLALSLAACGGTEQPGAAAEAAATQSEAPPPDEGGSTSTSTTTTTTAVPERQVTEQGWTPFATVAGITLHHPSALVERVGFHQSNHEGARELTPLPTTVAPATLESRERLTSGRTAADIVSHPETEIRSPVTGTVKRAGTYVLYCEHSDDYAVIAPDAQPAWEVKLLHIDGVTVRTGDRVVAGQTVIAPRPTQLPFESQVDELSLVQPAWPHVHVEVVDPSIPNQPSPGGGC